MALLAFAAVLVCVVIVPPAHAQEDGGDEPDSAGSGQTIGGTLRDSEGQGVGGVDIVVEQEETLIDEATTDSDGEWSVEVPGAGTYQVTLDTDTLPEDVGLRDADRATLENVRLAPGQSRVVIFPLGEGRADSAERFKRLANLAADGIRLGLILALASIGLSLIFGVTGLVNFAHGELVTFGALAAFFLSVTGTVVSLPLLVAAPIAVVLGSALGLGLERGLFRPLRRRRAGTISLIVVTIGLSLAMRHLYLIFFEGRPRPFDEFTIQRGASLGPISLRPKDWIIIGLSAVVIALVGMMLQKTRLGTAMRAVSDNSALAASSGIDVDRVIAATWILGAGLAALGGVLQGISETVVWDMGFTLLLLMFAAVILGGIGSAYGAVLGAVVIGLASQLSTYWISPKFRIGVGLAVLIVVILFRPQGILGRAERVG